MSRSYFVTLAAVVIAVTACKKSEPAPETPTPPPAAEPSPAPAVPAPTAPPAAVSPTSAAPAPAAIVPVMTDPCPMPGEDPSTCPTKQATAAPEIQVGHVLVGWDGSLPGKKVGRTQDEAKKLAMDVAHQARKPGANFVDLIWKFSNDPGPGVYKVNPELRGRYVPQFTVMADALGMGQVDVVETKFGYHVMKRLPLDFVVPEKPLEKVATDPCPGPGEDPTTCPTAQDPKPTATTVMHILIGYAGSLPGENVTMTKDEAKAQAIKLLHAARKKGADFAKLMKENSKDPGPGTYPVTPDAGLVPPFKSLGLSLGKGQIDIVETSFGYHIIKRTE